MSIKLVLLGTLAAAVCLFLWSGLTQFFPWGVPTTATYVSSTPSASPDLFQAPSVQRLPAHALTTPRFDTELRDKISTLTTDHTFSWIVTKPTSYYNPGQYFLREVLTQLLVGLLLTLLLGITRSLPLTNRLQLVGLAGLAGVVATYGQLYNWWGLPTPYALGVSVNLLAGWLLAGWVVARLISKPVATHG